MTATSERWEVAVFSVGLVRSVRTVVFTVNTYATGQSRTSAR